MTIAIKVPILPEDIQFIVVSEWHKREGDFVARGEALLDLQMGSELITIRLSRPGIVDKIIVPVGKPILPGTLLALIKEKLSAAERSPDRIIVTPYVPNGQEFTVNSRVIIQQILGERAGKYGVRVQTLPTKWKSQGHGANQSHHNGLKNHPMFRKGWRKEEYFPPDQLDEESLNAFTLRYTNSLTNKTTFNPAPTMSRR